MFEQVLDPALELSDLPDTDPVRTVELFYPVCRHRVCSIETTVCMFLCVAGIAVGYGFAMVTMRGVVLPKIKMIGWRFCVL